LIDVYSVPTERTSPRFARAFAQGCGGRVVLARKKASGPIAMFGSPHLTAVLASAVAEGRDFYYGDHAYFRRFQFYRVTKNGYQHHGSGKASRDRFERLGIEIEPWKRGRDILICPPDHAYALRAGFDADEWLASTVATLRVHTDRPLRFRARVGAERNVVTLRAALKDCHAMVTHHSNAAVEALCMGYPVFVTGDCAARALAETDLGKIETPRYPRDRRRWAAVLADNQWTFAEMAEGAAWRKLRAYPVITHRPNMLRVER